MTTVSVSPAGAPLAAAPEPIACRPRAASVFDPARPPVAATARIPPIPRLITKTPIVSTNHNPMTGQRWCALQRATRTVHGWRCGRGGADMDRFPGWILLRCRRPDDSLPARRCYRRVRACAGRGALIPGPPGRALDRPGAGRHADRPDRPVDGQ